VSTLRRLNITIGIAIAMALVGVLIRDGRVLAMSLPFLAYAGLMLFKSLDRRGLKLEIDRSLSSERIVEGETIDVTLSVINRGASVRNVCVSDRIPKGAAIAGGEASTLVYLKTNDCVTLSYRLTAQRGEYSLPGVDATSWRRSLLAPQVQFFRRETNFLVVPVAEPISDVEIRPQQTRAYAGIVRANQGGSGIDFFGCHAYTTGDDIRRINWRAYARTGELIVNEYEQERIADVTVFLDARAGANPRVGKEDTFTHAVRAAASVSKHFIGQGNCVGLLIYGDYLNWAFPNYGKIQLARILDSLARAEPADKEVFDDLRSVPTRLFPPRSQLVMVSSIPNMRDIEVIGVLRARGYRIMIVVPDLLAYQLEDVPSGADRDLALRVLTLRRRLLLDTLARIGIQVVLWDVTKPLSASFGWSSSRRGRRSA